MIRQSQRKNSLSFFKQAATENVFISPISVAAVLSMVGVGARGNTALQLKESMGLTKYASENGNSDSVIGSLIQSMKVHSIKLL